MTTAIANSNVDAQGALRGAFLSGLTKGIGDIFRKQSKVTNNSQVPLTGLAQCRNGLRNNPK